MDTSAISLVALLMSLLGGGGNDLLDYVPSDTYWQIKNVTTVNVDAMLAELKPVREADISAFVRDLGSPDPAAREKAERQIRAAGPSGLRQLREASQAPLAEVAQRAKALLNDLSGDLTARHVRRLVAVRTLGELKDKKALNALRPLLESKEPFVADYAAAAVASIEGKPYARPRFAETIAGDVALLPASCRAVAQVSSRGGRAFVTAEVLPTLHPPKGMTANEMLTESAASVVQLAEQLGNVRLDAITAGADGALSDQAGFAVAVARGRYDAERLRSLLRQVRTPSRRVENVEVFEPTGEVALLVPGDDLLVVCAAPRHDGLPLQAMIAAARAGSGRRENATTTRPATLSAAPEMAGLLKTIDTAQPLWAAARLTPSFRQVPLFAPFDTITLTTQSSDDPAAGLRLTLTAQGHDPGPVEDAARQADKLIRSSVEFLKGIAGEPLLDTGAAYLQTAKVSADGSRLTLTATLKPTPAAALFLPTALGFGENRPATRPAAAEPPKVQ